MLGMMSTKKGVGSTVRCAIAMLAFGLVLSCSVKQDFLLDSDVPAPSGMSNRETSGITRKQDLLIGIDSVFSGWVVDANASLDAFANATGTAPGNRRFRINIIIDADKAFTEADMIGQTFHCGKALMVVQKPVGRCAAINVDPKTALRSDKDYVRLMREKFGHSNLGVFAKVIKGGEVKVGDELRPI